jgi:hypothetical protein
MKIVIILDLRGKFEALSALPETYKEPLTRHDATAIPIRRLWNLVEVHTGLSK